MYFLNSQYMDNYGCCSSESAATLLATIQGRRSMAGMLQIITYLLAFYLVIKGVEILQIALASSREKRAGIIALGAITLLACIFAAIGFVSMQDRQAQSMSQEP
jgi:uncharacterized membrane protein HdeD (DUF308 family)